MPLCTGSPQKCSPFHCSSSSQLDFRLVLEPKQSHRTQDQNCQWILRTGWHPFRSCPHCMRPASWLQAAIEGEEGEGLLQRLSAGLMHPWAIHRHRVLCKEGGGSLREKRKLRHSVPTSHKQDSTQWITQSSKTCSVNYLQIERDKMGASVDKFEPPPMTRMPHCQSGGKGEGGEGGLSRVAAK